MVIDCDRFRPFTSLLLGDFMLDVYTIGKVKRISPEAPVPVIEVMRQEARPGGAGNAVLNLAALKGEVIAVGRVGQDEEGKRLLSRLQEAGANTQYVLAEPEYKTPVKNRLIANHQQLLRVDTETLIPLSPSLEAYLMEQLSLLIPQVEVVAVSDYGKGFLTRPLLSRAIDLCRIHKVPILIDPKGSDFSKYRGASILKPNLQEAYTAAKMNHSEPLNEVAEAIFQSVQIDRLLITRSEEGMSLFEPSGARFDFPVHAKEVKDVTGAGDTVLAVICASLACGLDISTAAQLSNTAAAIAIERVGCVQVTLEDLKTRLLENGATAEAIGTVIEDDRLARGDRALGRFEGDGDRGTV